MGPWSFPIVAEARMAERLLEVERARLALAAATGPGSLGREELPRPQTSPSSMRRLPSGASALALAGCPVLGGAPGLASSPCGVTTHGWVDGPAAWPIGGTPLEARYLLPVRPWP